MQYVVSGAHFGLWAPGRVHVGTPLGHLLAHLYVLSLCLVIEHVCNLLGKDLLPAGSGMDTHHGDANRPGGIADRHPEIDVIGLRWSGR